MCVYICVCVRRRELERERNRERTRCVKSHKENIGRSTDKPIVCGREFVEKVGC